MAMYHNRQMKRKVEWHPLHRGGSYTQFHASRAMVRKLDVYITPLHIAHFYGSLGDGMDENKGR